MKKCPDWLVRALKTFVQTFGAILIPEVCILLANGFPSGWTAAWGILSPIVASALSAAICAAWNIILEKLGETDKNNGHEQVL